MFRQFRSVAIVGGGIAAFVMVRWFLRSRRPVSGSGSSGAGAGDDRPLVVIVGAGFGGLRAARALAEAPVRVLLLDRNNFHCFSPLLYQVATAGLEPEEIAHPVRAILRGQPNFAFRMATVTGIDLAARRLQTTAGPIAYDYLVLAPGSVVNFFGLESVRTHAFALKDLTDAIDLRNRLLACFEQAVIEPDQNRRAALLTFAGCNSGAHYPSGGAG